jgi:hypothetical protein
LLSDHKKVRTGGRILVKTRNIRFKNEVDLLHVADERTGRYDDVRRSLFEAFRRQCVRRIARITTHPLNIAYNKVKGAA